MGTHSRRRQHPGGTAALRNPGLRLPQVGPAYSDAVDRAIRRCGWRHRECRVSRVDPDRKIPQGTVRRGGAQRRRGEDSGGPHRQTGGLRGACGDALLGRRRLYHRREHPGGWRLAHRRCDGGRPMTGSRALSADAELLYDVRCAVGESPVWDERRNRLWWVDAGLGALWWADLDGSLPDCMPVDPAPSFVALTVSDMLCIAAGKGWHGYDPGTRHLSELARPSASPSADWRLNDGMVDASGRIWTGSLGLPRDDANLGALYRFDAEGVHMLPDDLLTQNGL